MCVCVCVCGCVRVCVSESLKWLLCQQHSNLKIAHTYVWISFCILFVFPPLCLQPTPYCGTGGPTCWDLLEVTALTMHSGARPLSLSASSKACECLRVHSCVAPSITKLEPLLLINLTCLSSISPPFSCLLTHSTFHYLSYAVSCWLCLSLPPHFISFLLTLHVSFSLCLPYLFMSHFQTTYFTFIFPLSTPCVLSSFTSTFSPPLQSNSQSVVAEKGWRTIWNSDRQRYVRPPPALQQYLRERWGRVPVYSWKLPGEGHTHLYCDRRRYVTQIACEVRIFWVCIVILHFNVTTKC